jgi:hypothetical protein
MQYRETKQSIPITLASDFPRRSQDTVSVKNHKVKLPRFLLKYKDVKVYGGVEL